MALVGWLFADLVLIIALVAFGTQKGDPELLAQSRESARKGSSASPRPSPKPSRPSGPRSVEKSSVKIGVGGSPRGGGAERMVRQIRDRTKRWDGREAAMVLTFGGGQAGSDYAHSVNRLLHRARPKMFVKPTTRDFHDLGGPVGRARLEIYFYTR
jgi:hypothetical protein